jgi:hypothetical protein
MASRKELLSAVAPEEKVSEGGQEGGEDGGTGAMTPVIPQDGIGQGGVEHTGAVIFQGQIGQAGNAVLLADEQEQGDGESVAHGSQLAERCVRARLAMVRPMPIEPSAATTRASQKKGRASTSGR